MFKQLLPDQIVHTVYDIDFTELTTNGIQGIITDLDNTLVGAKEKLATPELLEWVEQLKSFGLQLAIVSNNTESRVGSFAKPLNIPFIFSARKPTIRSFKTAYQSMGLQPEQVAVIGDQLLTDVWGGKRAGLYTILVSPVAPDQENWLTRVNRMIERVAHRNLRKKGLWRDPVKRQVLGEKDFKEKDQ